MGGDDDTMEAVAGGTRSYKDLEGLAVALIVMFALILPMCMQVQNTAEEDQVHRRTFMSLICLERDFREFAIYTLEDPNTGNIGTYQAQLFSFQKKLHPWGVLDIKETLLDTSLWSGITEIYECEESPEARASVVGLYQHFPMAALEQWILLHPEISIRGDQIMQKGGWSFNMALVGLVGSLLLYISLAVSPGKEDETGSVLRSWSRLGVPALLCYLLWLLSTVVVLLVAQDEWVDSVYPFNMRDGNFFGAPNRQLNVFLFVPGTLVYIFGSFAAYCRACHTKRSMLREVVDDDTSEFSDAGVRFNGVT
mmetsp:Transcript_22859/g.52344  ORF Transcript_22859/g.52344 Transcript_22859/m.52344 type:complete len:309 (-) Transcript_22859:167-1093(-)